MSTLATLICNDLKIAKQLSYKYLHNKYIVVSADKTPNNIIFVSSIQALKQTL